jgi:diguanylate cyclase (GGDEF)-like protein
VDAQTRDTAGITTRLIFAYVRAHGGDDAVAEVLRLADVPHSLEELEDERTWSTYATKVALFEAAATVLDDPDLGLHVGESLLGYQIGGALRLVIGALGSPGQVLRSIAKANAKFASSSSMRCIEVTQGRGTVVRRLHPPRVPHRLDCDYTRGLLSQVSVLFGMPVAGVEHPQCQVEGADDCVYVITWQRRRRWFRRRTANPAATFELAALREQLVDLQRTVADLASTEDLDEVLRRIATRASAAVQAQRYLLAVQFPDEPAPRVLGEGYPLAMAQGLGGLLLAGDDGGTDDPRRMTAEVAAGGVRYGWLVAETSTAEGFLPSEEAQFEAYASMAATALTRARALGDARRRGQRAEALLDLAHGLALETTEVGAAERLAAAVPTVVNAEKTAIMLWDEDAACLRVAAVHGVEQGRDELLGMTVSAADTPVVSETGQVFRPRVLDADMDDPWIRQTLHALGLAVVVAAPIVIHGAYHGAVFAGWSQRHPPGIATTPRTLGSLADQAGTALAGIRLLNEAQHAATHDPLTGLPNRALFGQHLEQAIVADRRERLGTAMCFIDLDGFKAVNDRHGHAIGDELLVAVAARLRGQVRESDVVARISGDEFGVLLHRLERPDDAAIVGASLVRCLAEPFALRIGEVRIGGSIGIAFAAAVTDAEELLRTADDAMYKAKTERGTYHVADSGADRLAFDGSRTAVAARRELSN